jgi:D-3-phosphoglycerate dehydrogenase
MSSKKVIVFTGFPKAGMEVLTAAGLEPKMILDTDDAILLAEAADCVAPILGLGRWTKEVAEKAPLCKVVSRFGVGYDTVDVPACTAMGTPLMVTGTANSVTVAELAMQLLLDVMKKAREIDGNTRKGQWRPFPRIFDLAGKNVLVAGFGRIGQLAAARMKAFDMNVTVSATGRRRRFQATSHESHLIFLQIFDPLVPAEQITAKGYAHATDLHAALPNTDVLTLHLPKTPETVDMISAREIGLLKQDAVIINTARGGLVDEKALLEGLKSGKLFGAGLDVLETEPAPADHPLFDPSLNVALSPHLGAGTVEWCVFLSH